MCKNRINLYFSLIQILITFEDLKKKKRKTVVGCNIALLYSTQYTFLSTFLRFSTSIFSSNVRRKKKQHFSFLRRKKVTNTIKKTNEIQEYF